MLAMLPLTTISTRALRCLLCGRRGFSKLYQGDNKLREYVAKPSSKKPDPVWTRLASNIKDIELETSFSKVKHLEQLRTVYDPESAIGKLEDELQEEIASALGKTGTKCELYFSLLKKLLQKYENTSEESLKTTIAKSYNEIRVLARDARRDLIIHRQAAGFTYQNHSIVEAEYPLPRRLPTDIN